MSHWKKQAACIGEPYETFFGPDDAGPGGATWVAKAKEICGRCPVTEPCLTAALAEAHNGIDVGVRGGLSAKERREIRYRQMREQRQGAVA